MKDLKLINEKLLLENKNSTQTSMHENTEAQITNSIIMFVTNNNLSFFIK